MGKLLFGSLVVCLVASFLLSHVVAENADNGFGVESGSDGSGAVAEPRLYIPDHFYDNLLDTGPQTNMANYMNNMNPFKTSAGNKLRNELCKDASDLEIDSHEIKLWPNGSVPLVISKEFSKSQIKTIKKFIKDISRYTCVKFVNRTEGCAYVFVTKNYSIPWTFLGYSGQRQRLNIPDLSKQAVLRGFMNVLGIGSQHNTHNRDEYIAVKYENIDKRYWYQFRKFPSPTIMDEPYDFRSITHFSQSDYSKNTQDSIVPLNEEKLISPMSTLSPHDIAKLNRFYQCRFVDK